MILTIEAIVEDLVSGAITKQQAIAWLHLHAEGMANDLRNHFAGQAIAGFRQSSDTTVEQDVEMAFKVADAMMQACARGR